MDTVLFLLNVKVKCFAHKNKKDLQKAMGKKVLGLFCFCKNILHSPVLKLFAQGNKSCIVL